MTAEVQEVRRFEVRASWCEETVSLQVIGTRDEAIRRFEARFPHARNWYWDRGSGEPTPEIWDFDAMLLSHEGRMEEYWNGDGHETVLEPYGYPY